MWLGAPPTAFGAPPTVFGAPPTAAREADADPLAGLAALAAETARIRLGVLDFPLGLVAPVDAARALAALDRASGGRTEVGLAAGESAEAYATRKLSFEERGPRLDEALAVWKHLFSDERVSFAGSFYALDDAALGRKPEQRPWPPLHLCGESPGALRRAARQADGWIGRVAGPAALRDVAARLRSLRVEAETADGAFLVSARARVESAEALEAFGKAGADRVIVAPFDDAIEDPRAAVRGVAKALGL